MEWVECRGIRWQVGGRVGYRVGAEVDAVDAMDAIRRGVGVGVAEGR